MVTAGVNQGSVFGPLWFVLFVNYLPTTLHSLAIFFADDLKVIGSSRLNALDRDVVLVIK